MPIKANQGKEDHSLQAQGAYGVRLLEAERAAKQDLLHLLTNTPTSYHFSALLLHLIHPLPYPRTGSQDASLFGPTPNYPRVGCKCGSDQLYLCHEYSHQCVRFTLPVLPPACHMG
ncbi:hypothetical protein Pmani_015808 [Petrolisthes manimaculis]|uniref:Uncharacterized protein n=1 Tax=Petrolisthes manimaculis TaxID=1843537 RepID=A0AAE1PQA7_9EUCA|nr:hypothetical protein Pmani_015808 [Petrolisthes manimaculis]